jgi:hypothetical protein
MKKPPSVSRYATFKGKVICILGILKRSGVFRISINGGIPRGLWDGSAPVGSRDKAPGRGFGG